MYKLTNKIIKKKLKQQNTATAYNNYDNRA